MMFGITTFHVAVFFFFWGWGSMLAQLLWLADWHLRRKQRQVVDAPAERIVYVDRIVDRVVEIHAPEVSTPEIVERIVERPIEVLRDVERIVERERVVEVDRKHQDLSKLPTIVDIIRSMGIEPTTEMNWKVGGIARKRHAARYGRPPDKTLRPKTSGRGSHDLAVYPEEMRDEIKAIVSDLMKPVAGPTSKAVTIADPPPLVH